MKTERTTEEWAARVADLEASLAKAEREKELVRENLKREADDARALLLQYRSLQVELAGPRGSIMRRVIEERQRQDRKWPVQLDDGHTQGQLVRGATAYALRSIESNPEALRAALQMWPFDGAMKHYADPEFCLVVAMAMLMAEIERLGRAKGGGDLTTESTEATEGEEKGEGKKFDGPADYLAFSEKYKFIYDLIETVATLFASGQDTQARRMLFSVLKLSQDLLESIPKEVRLMPRHVKGETAADE